MQKLFTSCAEGTTREKTGIFSSECVVARPEAATQPSADSTRCALCDTYKCNENGKYLYSYTGDENGEHSTIAGWPKAGYNGETPQYTTTKEGGCLQGTAAWPHIPKNDP